VGQHRGARVRAQDLVTAGGSNGGSTRAALGRAARLVRCSDVHFEWRYAGGRFDNARIADLPVHRLGAFTPVVPANRISSEVHDHRVGDCLRCAQFEGIAWESSHQLCTRWAGKLLLLIPIALARD
jgi:hypothetical protein